MTNTSVTTFRVYMTMAITGSSFVEVEADSFQDNADGMFTFYRKEGNVKKFIASFKKDHIIAIIKK